MSGSSEAAAGARSLPPFRLPSCPPSRPPLRLPSCPPPAVAVPPAVPSAVPSAVPPAVPSVVLPAVSTTAPPAEHVASRGAFHLANGGQALAAVEADPRHRAHQRLQVGMARIGVDVLHRPALHEPAVIDHHHLVGHVRHHPQIVGDEEHRHAELGLQIAHELEYLRLDGHVERGGRLVGDEQGGAAHQRHRDHRALAQPSRELEGVAVQRPGGTGKPDHAEHLARERARLGAGRGAVQPHRLADLVPDRVQGRERGHRLLEDHRDPAAADRPHRGAVGFERRDVDALRIPRIGPEADLAPGDPRHRRQDPHHRLRDHRLPGSRLPHQRHRLAVRDAKRHPVDHAQHPLAVQADVHAQIGDFEDVAGHRGARDRHWSSCLAVYGLCRSARSGRDARTAGARCAASLMPDHPCHALRPSSRGLRGSRASRDRAPLRSATRRSTPGRPARRTAPAASPRGAWRRGSPP